MTSYFVEGEEDGEKDDIGDVGTLEIEANDLKTMVAALKAVGTRSGTATFEAEILVQLFHTRGLATELVMHFRNIIEKTFTTSSSSGVRVRRCLLVIENESDEHKVIGKP